MEITKVLLSNYLPYAKGTILGRAIPAIDGLKPAQRRILYTMYMLKLLNGDRSKSAKIVGATMQYHPHGDGAIYDTMVRMASGNDTLNIPYIASKGNFGKVYSKEFAYAASRYTEAKLADICNEMFDGINEGAVEYINNFDDSTVEPTLLPVKFPSILVNTSSGIAVGMSSSIPSFGLSNVCNSVIGILEGKITSPAELVRTLGIPQFTTGAKVHITEDEMAKIAETGRGTITMTGVTTTYPDSIVINEIPYRTTAEGIVAAIEEHVKTGELREVANVSDDIDLNGFKLEVQLKRGSNVQNVLKKLMIYTPLRSQVSFSTKVIVENECKTLGLLELLQTWIGFRMATLDNIYNFRLKKATEKEYTLQSWEKIKLDIRAVANLIANKNEVDAKAALMSDWKLEDAQAEYIMDMKIRQFTQDNLRKHLKELDEVRENIAGYNKVLGSDSEKYKIIIDDQKRIIAKYQVKNKTMLAPPLVIEKEDTKVEIDNDPVTVILTKNGLVKRLVSLNAVQNWSLDDDTDSVVNRFPSNNSDSLLVFTYDGTVHKIPVNSIDASKGKMRDNVASMIGIDYKQIMLIDIAGDYKKHFNVVFGNGRGCRVNYSKAVGNRAKYKNMFEASNPGEAWYTFSDKFFIVTRRRKAAYSDLEVMGMFNSRTAFKAARISAGDSILALQDACNVPDISKINLDKYHKSYTVLIGADDLWEGAQKKYYEAMGLDADGSPKAVEA